MFSKILLSIWVMKMNNEFMEGMSGDINGIGSLLHVAPESEGSKHEEPLMPWTTNKRW